MKLFRCIQTYEFFETGYAETFMIWAGQLFAFEDQYRDAPGGPRFEEIPEDSEIL